MQRFRWLLFLAAISFSCEVRASDDTSSTLDTLLSAWIAASRSCQSLDTTLTVIDRDSAWGEQTREGRLYFEAPDCGRFQIGDDDPIVWQPGNSVFLYNSSKTYERISTNQIATLRQCEAELLSQPRSWLDDFQLLSVQFALTRPQDAIPCLLLTDLDRFRAEFELKLDDIDGKPRLTAKPRQDTRFQPKELQFLFDDLTHLPEAVKDIRVSHERVYILETTRLNETPPDRDRLLKPDLKGWKSRRLLGRTD